MPAGSLDEGPGIAPEGHIFADSRPRWSCLEDGTSGFREYGPGWGEEDAS